MRSDALVSPCRCYRFALWRRWESGPQVLFIMLNPSTADELSGRSNDQALHRVCEILGIRLARSR